MAHDPWGELLAEARRLVSAAEDGVGLPHLPPRFEDPPQGMGDVAIPCFPYAKPAAKAPKVVAKDLAGAMPRSAWFPRIEPSGGYVNLFADDAKLAELTLRTILERRDAYGSLPPNDTRLLLEHTSVNPTGPIHVGRARNPIIGDALARVLRMAGYEVTTEYLVNDVGKQMVLLAWAVRHIPESELPPPERDKEDHRLVRHYQAANARLERDPALAREVQEMIRRFEGGDAALVREIRGVAEQLLRGMLETLERLGVRYDRFFWESDLILGGKVEPVRDRLLALPPVAEEDGAHYVDLAPFGVKGRDTRWFITRKDGTSLYATRDVAYHLDKLGRSDVAINVLGEDQKLEFQQLRAALKLLETGRDMEAIFYSHVSLPEGRMSTRKGHVVWMDDLVDEVVERATREVEKRREDLSADRKRAIAESVGVGAVRYNIARVQAEKRITFRWEEALNFEGDSAPFLQYAHARACGILAKADGRNPWDAAVVTHESETRLVRALARLPATISTCAEARRVHPLAAYVYGLATQFNAFYRDCPVLPSAEPVRSSRLALVEATRIALGNALRGLGLEALEEM